MKIDHVIYAAEDLERASARIGDELGLASVQGGRHEGHGTHNRIVPLGGGYLELLAVADSAEASGSVIGQALQARLEDVGEGLFAWAVAVDRIEPVAERLDLPVTEIARQGLTARLVGVAEALNHPGLPFFIARDEGVPDPGVGTELGGISWVEVACDAEELQRRLGGERRDVRVVDGNSGVHAMGIGEREFRTA
jgi:Glyoxalase-like domain